SSTGQPPIHVGGGKMEHARDGPCFAARIPDEVGIGEDRLGRQRHGQLLPAPIEHRASTGRERDVPHPLVAGPRLERRRILHLQQYQSRKDAAEAERERQEHGDQAPRRWSRGAAAALGGHQGWSPSSGFSPNAAGCATGSGWPPLAPATSSRWTLPPF